MSSIEPVSKAKVLASFASKGGVGKTTLVGNLAGALADMGQSVLLIDADHQGSLTEFYGRESTSEHAFTQFVTTQDYTDCISLTDIDGLEIICNDDFNKRLTYWLKESPASRTAALRVAVNKLRDDYDYILIDCKGEDVSGEIGEMAVRASDMLISPVSPDAMIVREFLNNAITILDRLKPIDPEDTINTVPVPHVCIYRYISNSKTHADFISEMRDLLADYDKQGKVVAMQTEIPQTVAYNDAQSGDRRLPVHRVDYKPRTNQKLPTAYQSITSLIHELFPELSSLQPRRSDDEARPTLSSQKIISTKLSSTVSKSTKANGALA